jgi:Eco29kI restriction endonuclease
VPDADQPYNPLDRVELGKSVERALLRGPLVALEVFLRRRPQKFTGAGLYALYYTGPLKCYADIVPPERELGEIPIYVGRARPPGARQGALGLESTTTEPVLFDRLHEHGLSVRNVEKFATDNGSQDLAVSDFLCRYLVADDIWVPLGEALLIGHYRPVWNVAVDGFGNHAPGGGREQQARSLWDTLHPGRGWAFRLPESTRSVAEVQALVMYHLSALARPDLDSVPEVDEEVRRALEGEPET